MTAEQFDRAGCAALAQGDVPGAVAAFRQAVALAPTDPTLLYNYGCALMDATDWVAAAACFERAARLRPEWGDPVLNQAQCWARMDQPATAIAALTDAVERRPDWTAGWFHLGVFLCQADRWAEAALALECAALQRPDWIEAWRDWGAALSRSGDWSGAVEAYRHATSLRPDAADLWEALGVAHGVMGEIDAAQAALLQADALGAPTALCNLGALTLNAGRLTEAAAVYRRWAERGGDPASYTAWLDALAQGSGAMEEMEQAAELRWTRCLQPLAASTRPSWTWRLGERPLRVGFYSGYLHCPQMGGVAEVIAAAADDATLTTELLAVGEHDGDSLRARGYDVLVHLDGAATPGATQLAARPAPIIVSWLHSFWPYGGDLVDWAISDAVLQAACSRRWDMPGGCDAYPPALLGPPSPPVLDRDPARPPTFGGFNRPCKLSDAAVAAWGRIMAATPDARLLLASRDYDHPGARDYALRRLVAAGIAPQRVEIVGSLPEAARRDLHRAVDVSPAFSTSPQWKRHDAAFTAGL